jgi:NhaA family Na+:H+ antiporter
MAEDSGAWFPWLARRPRAFVPDRALEAAQAFLRTEASGGIILLIAALAALIWVNSPLDDAYFDLWGTAVLIDTGLFRTEEDLQHLVNDGLMTIFFFVVGLEIKRELVRGELSEPRRALLPAAAALGGMIAPALIYTALNAGGDGSRGWGIPMATDIAFAVGVLSLLGSRIPFGLRIFLLALAIVDDIGAIFVIALFYTEDLALIPLGLAALAFLTVVLMNRSGVRNVLAYVAIGAVFWVALFESGVHATLAGVGLGLLTPSRPFYDPATFAERAERLIRHFREAQARGDRGDQEALLSELDDLSEGSEAPLERLERALHPWVSYCVMPLFALANAGIVLNSDLFSDAASSPITQGIVLGLVIGKVAGIAGFSWIAVRLGLCALPGGATWPQMLGVGLLGGIGFTVSLFITGLAFPDDGLVAEAKLGILFGSLVAGLLGFTLLRLVSHRSYTEPG